MRFGYECLIGEVIEILSQNDDIIVDENEWI